MSASALSDFDYELPTELIAQFPAAQRSASRLLRVLPRTPGGDTVTADRVASRPELPEPVLTDHVFADHVFADLPALLEPGDLLVMNDTRVIRARLFGHKASGGKVELLVERIESECEAVAMVRASHPPAIGSVLHFEGAQVTVRAREGAFFGLHFDTPVLALLERHGRLPLPPYIHHTPDAQDDERYQTVYARHPGAVAAPTAGLHMDAAVLEALAARGIHTAWLTLHVGAGTFQPIRDDDPERHVMHTEHYDISADTAAAIAQARARGARVVALGTTTLRALESAATDTGTVHAGRAETAIFIRPGYDFRVVDALVTNFHLPRSTLMMLVSAFAGLSTIRSAYAHAIAQRYRFFSYGDAMLLERRP